MAVKRLGLLLIWLGIVLRFLAVRELGAAWNNLPLRPERIIDTGIYRYITHPAYIGSICLFAGAFLYFPAKYHSMVTMIFIYSFYQNLSEKENYLLESVKCA